jgi:hypothetical protein
MVITLGNNMFIWVVLVEGYKGLPDIGTYLSYIPTGTQDEQRVKSVLIGARWEPLGSIHDAASSTHTHEITVSGSNSSSKVVGTFPYPAIDVTSKYIYATSSAPSLAESDVIEVLDANTTFEVSGGTITDKQIKIEKINDVIVGENDTASVVTGYASPTKTKFATSLTTKNITVVSKNTEVSIPNVTQGTSIGVSAVTKDNAPTTDVINASVVGETLVLEKVSVPSSAHLVTITPKSVSQVSIGSPIKASLVETTSSSVGYDITTADALTGLGTASKETVLKSVTVTQQPSYKIKEVNSGGDIGVAAGIADLQVTPKYSKVKVVKEGATISAPTIELYSKSNAPSGVTSVDVVTDVGVNITTYALDGNNSNLTALAQTWSGEATSSEPKD